MNNTRVASLCFVVALVFAPLPAQAQGNGNGNNNNGNGLPQLASALAALQGRVATLESGQAALDARVAKQESGQFDEADLVGTYAMQILGIEMLGAPARIGTETSVVTISLNAGGTVGGTFTDGRCTLQQGPSWSVTCDPINPEVIPPGVLSWTVTNGTLVISQPGDENFEATIGAGGRILVAGGTSTVVGSWSNIVVMIRLPNP